MDLRGIILTGTSGAGKTSVANGLCLIDKRFERVKAITTRKKRYEDDNEYIHTDELNFLSCKKCYFTVSEYRGERYAISLPEISKVIEKGKIPVLIMTPSSVKTLKETKDSVSDTFLSFFIDAPDDQLDQRLLNRNNKKVASEDIERRREDRKYSDIPNYIIQNSDISKATEVVKRLYDLYGRGTLLSESDIRLFVANGMLVDGASNENIKGASYDLRLGDEYYYSGEIKRFEKQDLKLTIEPYDYAIVSSKEEICLPKDVVAHFGLTVGLFCQGIILSNGQQVDPGFRGTLFCLLFNTSNQSVTIKRAEHYATIEFTKMDSFASKYKGKYQEKRDVIDVIPANAMQGAINVLKKEIEELKAESHNMQNLYLGVMSLIIAAISILLIIK